MARQVAVRIEHSPKREDSHRHISHYRNFRLRPVTGHHAGLHVLLTRWQQANRVVLDGCAQSNHGQGGGQHEAQFLVGVAQRIFDELG